MLIQPQSCLVVFHVRDRISDWILSRVADEGAEAATVYIVSLNIEKFESVVLEEKLHRFQSVIFEVFVTDVVETVLFEHCCEVVLLHSPDSLRGENFTDVGDEAVWIL